MTKKDKEGEEQEVATLDAIIKQINKKFGDGTIVSKTPIADVQFVSSGCLSLDKILGGGWARGRIHEMIGLEASGKSTLALTAVTEVQKLGEKAAYIDIEHALDPKYMKALGVNLEELIITQPNAGEEALDIVEMLTRSGQVSLIVIDSVAALVPQRELENNMGDSAIGLQARLMSQAMRKLAAIAHQTNTTLLFINQIRLKIGIAYGNPEVTSGGLGLKYAASQRVDLRRKEMIKQGDKITGSVTRAKIIKNKVAPPFQECTFIIKYGEGIDVHGDVLSLALEVGLVEKKGAWYSLFGQVNVAQGEQSMIQYLKDNPAIFEELKCKI
jgi:recombination protein RecA